MRKNLLVIIACIMVMVVIAMAINIIVNLVAQKYFKKPEKAAVIYTNPKKGTVLYREEYKGMEVPVVADGLGNAFRYIANVPWDRFTIEEKFDMVRVNGGHLSIEDMARIWFKFGEWRKAGNFYGITIYRLENDSLE